MHDLQLNNFIQQETKWKLESYDTVVRRDDKFLATIIFIWNGSQPPKGELENERSEISRGENDERSIDGKRNSWKESENRVNRDQ